MIRFVLCFCARFWVIRSIQFPRKLLFACCLSFRFFCSLLYFFRICWGRCICWDSNVHCSVQKHWWNIHTKEKGHWNKITKKKNDEKEKFEKIEFFNLITTITAVYFRNESLFLCCLLYNKRKQYPFGSKYTVWQTIFCKREIK